MTKPMILKRSDRIDSTPVLGQAVRVKDPKYLSLVKSPANQTAFRIVRSDTTGAAMPATKKTTVKRIARSAPVANPVLRLAFPEGSTAESVVATLANFGMTSNYTVSEVDGIFLATRADVQSIAPEAVETLLLNDDGLTATIARSDDKRPAAVEAAPEPGQGLTLTAIEFDLEKIDHAAAQAWLQRNAIDISLEENENSTASIVVSRSEVAEGTEVRQMEVEPGVVLSLIRSDEDDLPAGVYAAVSEKAYGSWGWSQLDFNAAMADVVFCEQARKGMDRLDGVLREIMFYSALPLDVRKTLVGNALTQFGEFIYGFMDMLPRQMLVSLVRSDSTSKEKEVSKPAETTQAPAADAPAAQTITMTRADLDAAIAEGVNKVLAARDAQAAPAAAAVQEVQRSDDPAAAAAPAETAQVAGLTRADLAEALAEMVKPLQADLEKIMSTTIVRSDPGDSNLVNTAQAQRSDKDPASFDGAIPGIGRRK